MLAGAGLLLVGTVLLRALWLPVAIERLAPLLSGRVLPFRIQVQEVLAADLGRIELRGLALEALAPDEALRSLRLAEVRARFSLPRLLRGDPLGAIRRLEARDGALELDLAAPGEERSPTSAEPGPGLPEGLASLQLADIDLRLRLASGERITTRVRELSGEASGLLTLALDSPEFETEGTSFRRRRLELRARYQRSAFEEVELDLDGRPFLVRSRLDLRLAARGELDFELRLHPREGELEVRGRSSPAGLELQVLARQLALEELLAELPAPPPELRARTSFQAQLALPPGGLSEARGSVHLRAEAVQLGPVALELLELEAALARGRFTLARLVARDGASALEARELSFPIAFLDGPFDLARAFQESRGHLRARIAGAERLVRAPSPLAARALEGARAELEARFEDGRLELEASSLESPAARVELARGFLQLHAGEPLELDLDLDGRLDISDLEAALALFEQPGWGGSLAGEVSARGRWPAIRARADLRGLGVLAAGVPLGALALEAELDSTELRVESLRARSGAIELDLQGRFDRQAEEVHDALLAASVPELEALLPGRGLAGRLSLDLRAQGPLAELSSALRVDAGGLRLGELPPVELALVAHGSGRAIGLEQLDLRSGSLGASARGQLELDSALAPRAFTLLGLTIGESGEELLHLERPAYADLAQGVEVDELALAGALGSWRVRGRSRGSELHWKLETRGLDPMRLARDFLPPGIELVGLDLELELERSEGALALASTGEIARASHPALPEPGSLAWSFSQRSGRLVVDLLEARLGTLAQLDLDADLPFDLGAPELIPEGALALRARLELPLLERLWSSDPKAVHPAGRLALEADLHGETRRVLGRLTLVGEELALERAGHPRVRLGDSRLEALLGERIELPAASFFLPDARSTAGLTLEGAIGAALDLGAIQRDPADWLASAPLALDLRADLADLSPLLDLAESLGLESFPLRAGELHATARLEGTLARPCPRGSLSLADGTLRLSPDFPTISPLEVRIELDDTEARIASVRGELGGAPFEIQGEVELSRGAPRLDLRLTGKDLLLHRSRGIQVRADAGIADAEDPKRRCLAIRGPLDALDVSGTLALGDSRFTRNFEVDLTRPRGPRSRTRGLELFRFAAPPLSGMRFDVEIVTREPFEIRNTTVSGGLRPDLFLRGTGEVPYLVGPIYVDPTTLSLPGSNLRIAAGTIQFREEDPFVPALALRGGTRLRGYEISLNVSGTLEEPEILLSSSPPLPDNELLLLVTTGQVPTEGEAASASDTARVVALYLAKDFLARWLADESTEPGESLFDRLEVISGRDVSKTGADTIWVSFRLARKSLGSRDTLYLVAERDLYDHYNYGLRVVFRFR